MDYAINLVLERGEDFARANVFDKDRERYRNINTLEEAKEAVKENVAAYLFLKSKFLGNEELIDLTIDNDGYFWNTLPEFIRWEKKFIKKFIERYGSDMMYIVPSEFSADEELFKFACDNENRIPFDFKAFDSSITDNKELIKYAIKTKGNINFNTLPYRWKDDDEIFLYALDNYKGINIFEYKIFSERLRSNKEYAKKWFDKLKCTGIYDYMAPVLKEDRELLEYVISTRNSASVVEEAAESIRMDKDYMIELIKKYPAIPIAAYVDEKLLEDREIAKYYVSYTIYGLYKIKDEFKADKDIVLAAITSHDDVRQILEVIPQNLKEDRDICMAIIKKDRWRVRQIGYDYSDDEEFLLLITSLKFDFFEDYVPEKWRGNRDFVSKAIRLQPYIYSNISDELKKDKELFEIGAVLGCPSVLEHAPLELRDDPTLLGRLVKAHGANVSISFTEKEDGTFLIVSANTRYGYDPEGKYLNSEV